MNQQQQQYGGYEYQQPQHHQGYAPYQPDPSHQWTPQQPTVSIEQYQMEIEEEVQRAEQIRHQFEFCRNRVEYGILDLFLEMAEADSTKSKLQTIEYDYHRLKDELRLLDERIHKKAVDRGYTHINQANGAVSSHVAVSHAPFQNAPPGQWNMDHTQGQHIGQPGYPPQQHHPSFFGSVVRGGAKLAGWP